MAISRGDMTQLGLLTLAILLNLWPVNTMSPESERSSASEVSEAAGASLEKNEVVTDGEQLQVDGSGEGDASAASGVRDSSALASIELQGEAGQRWELPKALKEISGLSMTSDETLLAHGDEKGTVYELDFQNQKVIKSFRLAIQGQFVAADFEGIAQAAGKTYMSTSNGRIYEFVEGEDGAEVPYVVYDTGLESVGEFESLDYDSETDALLLACKNIYSAEMKGSVAIYSWSIERKAIMGAPLLIPLDHIAGLIGEKRFSPSGIALHPVTNTFFLVAGPQQAIAEITRAGEVIGVRRLSKKHHRQAEGISFTADGTLILADEASGAKPVMTLYTPRTQPR